jgi:hypothetical protein
MLQRLTDRYGVRQSYPVIRGVFWSNLMNVGVHAVRGFFTGLALLALLSASKAPSVLASPRPGVSLIANGGFELPSLTASPPPHFGKYALVDLPYYVYPALTKGKSIVNTWVYQGASGIINATSPSNPWYGITPPTGYAGDQYGFIQSLGVASHSFTVTVAGDYLITWLDAGRPDGSMYDGNQTYNVVLSGNVLSTFQTTSSQNFTQESLPVTLTEGTYVLAFQGTTTSDHTAFIDAVRVSKAK